MEYEITNADRKTKRPFATTRLVREHQSVQNCTRTRTNERTKLFREHFSAKNYKVFTRRFKRVLSYLKTTWHNSISQQSRIRYDYLHSYFERFRNEFNANFNNNSNRTISTRRNFRRTAWRPSRIFISCTKTFKGFLFLFSWARTDRWSRLVGGVRRHPKANWWPTVLFADLCRKKPLSSYVFSRCSDTARWFLGGRSFFFFLCARIKAFIFLRQTLGGSHTSYRVSRRDLRWPEVRSTNRNGIFCGKNSVRAIFIDIRTLFRRKKNESFKGKKNIHKYIYVRTKTGFATAQTKVWNLQ